MSARVKIEGVAVAAPPGAVAYKADEPESPARWLHDEDEAERLVEQGSRVAFTDAADPGDRATYRLELRADEIRAWRALLLERSALVRGEMPDRRARATRAAERKLLRLAELLDDPEANAAELARRRV